MTAAGAQEQPAPDETARAFIEAVVWGEHHRVWDLLGTDARKTVLRLAVSRGMDEGVAMRLRTETATPDEVDRFLSDLVQGLRVDLAGTDVDNLEYRIDEPPSDGGNVRVRLCIPLPPALAAAGGPLPVGSVELGPDATGRWRVERLVPRPRP